MIKPTATWLLVLLIGCEAWAQIPKPQDAPLPLAPETAAQRFQLPPGFRVELVASEPLVREPSGVCWDEAGQLYLCELHGYNLEGQYDIEELNKTGQLDRVVQRIQADERHKQAAEAGTYGTIKRLLDSDGDGRVDRADVWADRLPPCLGICAARGGIIAACKTQILYLADRDHDGQADIKEVLFEGFQPGPLERSINCPQFAPDNWIYFGRGAGGGTIRGPHLAAPVMLPNTDFRIKPDGTAIEPVVGSTATMGFTFTEAGDRLVISTNTPGIFVAPIAWHYLARNPDVAAPSLQQNASSDQKTYPISHPHPWRTRRAEDPGFSKLYTDRYGITESAPNGYFTSACSPLVYQDIALPGLRGQLLACEPAQNMVHRALVRREGSQLKLGRDPSETASEFLASSDPWFHAIALAHAPDGSVYIVDFYREIIEDYSAIPRYLQQQYGLMAGQNHGRLWRLTHNASPVAPRADMSRLTARQLADELQSPHYWRRVTARRLLIEKQSQEITHLLIERCQDSSEPAAILNMLHTLDGLNALDAELVSKMMQHSDPSIRRQSMRYAERWLDSQPQLLAQLLARAADREPMVRLQAALSLGESRDERVMPTLSQLARHYANEPWMGIAVLSAVPGRAGQLLGRLLESPEQIDKAVAIIEPLCLAIANRKHGQEISDAILAVDTCPSTAIKVQCLRGFNSGLKKPESLEVSSQATETLKRMSRSRHQDLGAQAQQLVQGLKLESPEERKIRLAALIDQLHDLQLDPHDRLSAAAQLAVEDDPQVTQLLLGAIGASTPAVGEAILNSIFSRRERVTALLEAMEQKVVSPSMLSAVQRSALLESKDAQVRQRAAAMLERVSRVDAGLVARYTQALAQPRDPQRGQQVFREHCANCHQAHGLGHAVGPDLNAEFQRAEETILRDVLSPSDTISSGYVTYVLSTSSGQVVSGLLASETPTSLNMLQAGGKLEVVLRKDVDELRAVTVSMMPEDLAKSVAPQELADLLDWLRRPPQSLVLLDDNSWLASALNEGSGTAEFTAEDKVAGQLALRITAPQRHSPRIKGWEFRIREHPGAGEYRFVRFSWKTAGARGVMIELADNGRWPPADKPLRRYHSGSNTTGWQSIEVSSREPIEWTTVTRDLWKDFGDFTLTGMAPTAMGGAALLDRMELLQSLPVDRPEGER